ncbi:MAG: hypothetical protein V3W18_03595 [candidate division Zixibacteria bacterium]
MNKSPRKIGIITSGGNPWEIVFCVLHLENYKFIRSPITYKVSNLPPEIAALENDLSRQQDVDIEDVKATGIEGLIVPGGIRIFNNLCDFEDVGAALKVDDGFKNLLKNVYRLEKPIGALGEAALLVTKALQGITKSGLVVTVGNDPKIQGGIEKCGAQAVVTRPGEVVLDETNKIITSGGELGTRRAKDIYSSCENLISGMNGLIESGD